MLTKVVDALTSDESNAALSAKQGKVLNDKINAIGSSTTPPPPITPTDIVVDTLANNETNKAPSVHITKESLSTKASLDTNTNKIPISSIPDEAIPTVNKLRIMGGANIRVSDLDNDTYVISKADTKEDVLGYINDINLGPATSNQKWVDICYCNHIGGGLYIAIAEDTNKAMKSSNGKDWEEITLPYSMKYHCIAYDDVLKMVCIAADNSKEILVSNDGATFTKVALPVTDNILAADITSIYGRFVILSKIGELFISANDDCTNWQKIAPTIAIGPNKVYNAICYNDKDKKLAIVGNDNTQFLISSKISINDINTINTFTSYSMDGYEFVDVAYSYELDMYCAIGGENAPDILDKVYTSIDGGITWKSNNIRASDWKKCIWVPDWKAFVFMSSQEKICAISLDGNNFDIVNLPEIDTNVSNYSSLCYSSKNDRLVLTIYNSDKFAAMSIDGKKLKLRWTKHYIDIKDNINISLQSICWSPELHMFCAVGYYNNKAITSSDGITWTKRTLSNSNGWHSICWSPELHMFCAVCEINSNNGIGITSPDGIRWTGIILPGAGHWQSICWSSELHIFCAIAYNSNKAVTSSDGITWTERTLPINSTWQSICWSPELRIFCAIDDGGRVITSPDGITWNQHPILVPEWIDVCWSPKLRLFCIIGNNTKKIATSPDGITWTERTTSSSNVAWRSICWCEKFEIFYAVALNNHKTATSSDGITWNEGTIAVNYSWRSICWAEHLSIFCGIYDTNKVATSVSGTTWDQTSSLSNIDWSSICWSPEQEIFCAIAYDTNKVATSPDGETWTERTLPSRDNWSSICWAPKLRMFYAVAYNSNKLATSPNGINWTETTLPSIDKFGSICWAEELEKFLILTVRADVDKSIHSDAYLIGQIDE